MATTDLPDVEGIGDAVDRTTSVLFTAGVWVVQVAAVVAWTYLWSENIRAALLAGRPSEALLGVLLVVPPLAYLTARVVQELR